MVCLHCNLKCCPEFVWGNFVGDNNLSGHELKMGTYF